MTLTKNNKYYNKNKTCKNRKGGNVIGRGGYGCVFYPALKCKNKKTRVKNKISKLMKIKHVDSELDKIKKFYKLFKNIDNFNDYFILNNVDSCDPAELTDSDLDNFNQTCISLLKIGINKENINENLDKLSILNIPYGGISISKYIESNNLNFNHLNKMLLNLLVGGIFQMNKLGVYHNDIKDANILVGKDENCRIIDWGISVKTTGSVIPKNMKNRPFQYNSPFSTILFSDEFIKSYKQYLKTNKNKYPKQTFTFEDAGIFVKNYVKYWNTIRGIGHLDTILELIDMITNNDGNAMDIILEYITKIVFKYTNEDDILIIDYFKNIYLENVDIWGFLMVYVGILEKMLIESREHNAKNISLLRNIFKKYLFHTPTKAINKIELVKDLNKLF